MAFPFLPIAMVLSSILPSLFGGGGDEQTQTTTTETDSGYQSPMLGMLDPYITKALLGNFSRLQGAGFPKGLQNLGLGGMNTDIFSLLDQEWPEIMKQYQTKKATGGGSSSTTYRAAK
ncbi:MAG: hypothetical protein WC455_22940 [Dehalococcoidia bacterium]